MPWPPTPRAELWGIQPKTIIKDSVIKLNYIFTISLAMIEKTLFSLQVDKKKEVHDALTRKLDALR